MRAPVLSIVRMLGLGGLGGLAALGGLGCRSESTNASMDAALTAPSASAPEPAPTRKPPAPPPREVGPCRVMASENGLPASADPSTWLTFPPRSSSTIHIASSGREIRFEGPARARPCMGSLAVLSSGTAISLPSAGDAPGAETWVATPCGTARFGAGIHRIAASAEECSMQSSVGTAFLYVGEGIAARSAVLVDGGVADAASEALPLEDGWARVDTRRGVIMSGPRSSQRATAICEHAVEETRALAARMLDASSGLGDLAAQSVAARRTARAACGVAAARSAARADVAMQARIDGALESLDGKR